MLSAVIDRLGEFNPQLFRELKGRLKPRHVWLTIGVAIVVQIIFLKCFVDLLPYVDSGQVHRTTYALRTSTGKFLTDGGLYITNWQKWWQDIFRLINWALPYIITVPSVYLLTMDVQQEESRGTLNFVRLSPQSARSILLGKLLGVPALVYLGVLTLLPLHIVAAVGTGGAALSFLISYYILIGVGSYVLFSLALLLGCLTKPQPKLGAQYASGVSLAFVLLVIFVIAPLYINWNVYTAWHAVGQFLWFSAYSLRDSTDFPQWFYLSLKHPGVAHMFTLTNLIMASHWIWQALKRHFHTPNRTLLGKPQSYGLVAYFQVLMLGFCLSRYWEDQYSAVIGLAITICLINVGWFIWLTMLLSPERQTVMDWARYRHQQSPDQGQPGQQRSLLHELLWNDRSPATVAIMVNLLLASAILLPWILTFDHLEHRLMALMGLVFNATLISLYALIFQWVMLAKTAKRGSLAVGSVFAAILAAPLGTFFLALGTVGTPPTGLLFFSPFFWLALDKASAVTVGMSLLAEWVALIWVGRQLTRSIQRLGASESQTLLSGTGLVRP
jgi:hypothetical protein